MIPALVLTAGLATRLRPLSLVRAKAALPVGGEPLAGRILLWLAAAGVRDAVLNLHHLPASITGRIGDGATFGVRVRYSWEGQVLGSAGGPKRAAPLLDAPTFLVVNGDTLCSVDLAALVAAHRASGALVTMATVPQREPERYRSVLADHAGAVRAFAPRNASPPAWHYVGVQVVDAEVFDDVPPDVPYETVAGLYPSLLAARPGAVRIFPTAGTFHDIGTPADYLATALQWTPSIATDAKVHPTAVVERSVLWDGVTVEAGVVVRESVVTDGVRLPAGSTWERVTIRTMHRPLAEQEQQVGDLAVAPL